MMFLCLFIESFSQPLFLKPYPDTLNKRKLYATIGIETSTYIAGLSFLSFIWYKDRPRTPFHLYDDSKGYLQVDKAGHAFTAYRESYAAYYALRSAGVSKTKSLLFGGPIGVFFQTPIEIFDGLYEGWGFSWSDMGANAFGSALFMTQEALFNDQILLMKFSYSPSKYANYHSHLGESHLERFFLDYNGHTYWLSGNLRKLSSIKKIPNWISLAVGYSANGMIYEFDNPKYYRGKPFQHFERVRQFLFSLDLDLSRIKTNKKGLKYLFRTLNLIKIPFPALELNQEEGLKFRPLYF
jgi:hypothetical protein